MHTDDIEVEEKVVDVLLVAFTKVGVFVGKRAHTFLDNHVGVVDMIKVNELMDQNGRILFVGYKVGATEIDYAHAAVCVVDSESPLYAAYYKTSGGLA